MVQCHSVLMAFTPVMLTARQAKQTMGEGQQEVNI
jgi:hypothetical protein